VKRGRPRAFNPRIPAHIDQAKLPDGVYFDHRWGGTWYLLQSDEGRRTRKNIAGIKATLAELHQIVEQALGGDSHGTLDWLCGKFEESEQFKSLATGTRTDYCYCRAVLGKEPTKIGVSFGSLKIAGLTPPIIQRLVDRIAQTHPSKANHVLRYLRRLFCWGGNRYYCHKVNPGDGIEAAKERKRRQLPTPAVMAAVAQYAASCGALQARTKGAQPPYLWAVAEIAYLCRLRGIEVVTLTDAHATPEGMMTNRRKGSRDNVVTWTRRLRAAWDYLVERRGRIWKERSAAVPMRAEDRWVVVSEDGTRLRRATLATAWQRLIVAAIAAGIITADQRFGLHGFKRRGITDTKGNRRYQRARPSGRHRQGAGMARSRQHRHDAHLRPPQDQAGRQPNVQGGVLTPLTFLPFHPLPLLLRQRARLARFVRPSCTGYSSAIRYNAKE
jgi:hypothetical protein